MDNRTAQLQTFQDMKLNLNSQQEKETINHVKSFKDPW